MQTVNTTASTTSGAMQGLHWRHFIAAPHRMFFFGGVWALVLSILWWLAVLLAAPIAAPAPHWIHGWLMLFGTFPFFVFGFLITALPRWLGSSPLPPAFYRSSALAMMAGYLLVIFGALWYLPLATVGMALTCAAWLANIVMLLRLFPRCQTTSKTHPIWAVAVVTAGCIGGLIAVRGGFTADPAALRLAPQFGLWAFLAGIIFIVAHRVLPFFTRSGLADGHDYRVIKPRWSPAVVIPLLWVHALLAFNGYTAWLFVVDLPLLVITGGHWLAWQPWKTRAVPLLWTLYIAFAWLPIALALSSIQSLTLQFSGNYILGLAPLHALAIGLGASMVFAMVTRVSLGHSGRKLQMPGFAVVCFVILQLSIITRICAELAPSGGSRSLCLTLSSIFWLCAFTPWALRLTLIYWQPRVDARPG